MSSTSASRGRGAAGTAGAAVTAGAPRAANPSAGGPIARARHPRVIIAVLSGALALAAADQTIVGAVAPDLKVALGIDNAQIGLLVTLASLTAAATTIPFGILADRAHRVRLLALCAMEWSVSVGIAGISETYTTVVIAQLALGAGVGAAGPIVASLVGDLFPAGSRGRALGFILAGEFAGAASGLLVAGELAAVWSWRGSFWVLGAVGPVLAVMLLWFLPEPARGVTSREPDPATAAAPPSTADTPSASTPAAAVTPGAETPDPRPPAVTRSGLAAAIERAGVPPRPHHVLTEDPARKPLRWAVRHVLSIPTNVVIIIASAMCYFYVAGMQTFAIVYLRGRFDLSQEWATALLVVIGAGVIAGILTTGTVSDRRISRGHATTRPVVGGLCFAAALVFFTPGFFSTVLVIAVPLLFLGAAALGGVNPPLDAARLDVVHSRLWGRAEAVRTFLQNLIKAGAPLLFGWMSTVLAHPDEDLDAVQGGGAVGLTRTFLVLQVVFVIAGVVLLLTRRAYTRDVATALASERAVRRAASR